MCVRCPLLIYASIPMDDRPLQYQVKVSIYIKMEVRVKYQVISRATISSISYSHQCGILTVVADGNDTASFFSASLPDMNLITRFQGESKPPSLGCISWSPNGLMIAVANVKVQLWKFQGTKLSPIRVIDQKFVEIKSISWSQDSQFYLCYGVTAKDSPLSINIRHTQSNQLRQIITNDPPILASFDPFGKYIAVLMVNNTLDLYDSRTLDKVKSSSMAESKNDIPTLRDKRNADWSPQYSYFAIPNLNDSKLPTAIVLDRNKSFSSKQIIVGHQATISCLKFNPQVFEYEGDTTFILAVGDSSGCLSLWRIGKHNSYKQPLFIASSPNKAEQSIEGMEWNNEGDLLIVNVLKKYVILMGFKLEDLGKKLTEEDKSSLIIATYGASGASEITGKKLEVFGHTDIAFKNQMEHFEMPKATYDTNFEEPVKPKQPLVKTKQEVIYNKDANNKEKKRIIPSKFVPESQINQIPQAQTQTQNQKSQVVPTLNGAVQILQATKFPVLKLPVLKQQPKRQYYLPNGDILLVDYSKNVYSLSIKSHQNMLALKETQFKRFFNGEIRHLTITQNHILILNNQKLFILTFDLKLEELPCYLGEVSNFTVNNSGTVFYMTTGGLVRGFNYLKHEFIFETSINYLMMGQQAAQITINPLLTFVVFDQDSNRLHIQLKNNFNRYFFCKETNSWNQFNFDDGFYLPGHSLKIRKNQKSVAQNFYMNLVTPAILVQQSNKSQSSTASLYQMQLLYYHKYVKDTNKFKEAIIRMIADLKSKGNEEQLRKQIIKYFIDRDSQYYIEDTELWDKVKKIGGKIIQQFLMLGKIGSLSIRE